MKKISKLKAAIREAGKTQKDIATATLIDPMIFGLAVNNRYILNKSQKNRIAIVLKRTVKELF